MALEDEEDNDEIETMQSSSQSVLTHLTEIVLNILLRLPVNSLLRCKSVCKSWRSLISDPHFVKSHLLTSNNHPRLIFTTGRNSTGLKACGVYDVVYDNSINNALELDYPLKDARKFVEIVGSCNGLVCLAIGLEEEAIVIWNPSTRKSTILPHRDLVKQFGMHAFYGFGYQESNDDYKLVQISCLYKGMDSVTRFEICSLKSGNWKEVAVIPFAYPSIQPHKFLNGALYSAIFASSKDHRSSCSWTIFSLDLTTETYEEVLQPVYDEGHEDLTLGTLREWLCVLCEYRGIREDLWIMKVYGVKESWTKLVPIPYLTDPRIYRFSVPLCISNDGKILLQFWSKLIVYDSKNTSFAEVQINCARSQVSTFVESLVSPMHVASRGDRS